MKLWTDIPQQDINLINLPNNIYTGNQTLDFNIEGLENDVEAAICIFKKDQVYSIENITGDGTVKPVSMSIKPDSPTLDPNNDDEKLFITVTAGNHLPEEKSYDIQINPDNPHVFISAFDIDDDKSGSSNGNADFLLDAGETIELNIILENQGAVTASNITAELETDNSHFSSNYITVNPAYNQSGFPDIISCGTSSSNETFVFDIDKDAPDVFLAKFILTINCNSSLTFTETLYCEVHASDAEIIKVRYITENGDDILEAGEEVELYVELINRFTGKAVNLTGVIDKEPTTPIEDISVYSVEFGDINPYSRVENTEPFVLILSQDYQQGDDVRLLFTLENEYGHLYYNDLFPAINLKKPDPPTQLGFNSMYNSISLFWEFPLQAGIKGFNVYRSEYPDEGFDNPINTDLVEFSTWTDENLDEYSKYYYKITSVTKGGTESLFSDVLYAWTTLPYHPDWPEERISTDNYGNNTEGAVMTADFNSDGKKEIFFTMSDGSAQNCESGGIMGFYHDKDNIYNIDDDITSVSGIYKFNKAGSRSNPALVDINNDGILDIITTTKGNDSDFDRQKLFIHSLTEKPDGEGPDLLCSSQIGLDYNGVTISDLDNDGKMEIIQKGPWASSINVFYVNNNNELANYPNWPVNIGEAIGMGMPLAIDINNDGYKEVFCGFSNQNNFTAGIYAFTYNGEPYIQNSDPEYLFYQNGDGGTYDRMDCKLAAADINNDNFYEIIAVSGRFENNTPYGRVFILDRFGNEIPNWEYDNPDHKFELTNLDVGDVLWLPSPSVGNLDSDSDLEVVIADKDKIYCWQSNGDILNANFPIEVPDMECKLITPLLADVDTDNDIEIIISSNHSTERLIHAYNTDGSIVLGFPLQVPSIFSTPCIDDIDNDSKNEIIATGSERVYCWDTKGSAERIEWGKVRHDRFNSGIYGDFCPSYLDITVDQDEVWSVDKVLSGDLIVEEDVNLQINGNISFPEGGKMIIKAGATVEINDAILTNGCRGQWQGIEVWGDKNSHQFTIGGSCAQGKLALNNVTIENAFRAVRLWNPNDENTSGGIIVAENSTFRNSMCAVEFVSYHNYDPNNPSVEMYNQSIFKDCQFEVNEQYNQASAFSCFVSMWDVYGIDFKGCKFNNLDDTQSEYGTGITSIDAGYTVTYYCEETIDPCPPEFTIPSEFSGLFRGIDCANEQRGYYPVVKYSDFTDNRYGIYNNGANYPVYIFNNFTNTKLINNYSIGIVLDGCTGFTVEENTFTNTSQEPVEDFMTFGVWVNNSGEDENMVYRNSYTDMFCANYATGINLNELNTSVGLKYECNINTNNYFDFYVENDAGIATVQGSINQAAGNEFSHLSTPNGSDFNNQGNWFVHYYYDPLSSSEIPENYIGIEIFPSTDHQCQSNFGGEFPKMDASAKCAAENTYLTSNTEYEGALTAYNSFKDEGDTPELVSDIDDYQPDQTNELRNRLLNDSPHLSEEALRKAADTWDVLPSNILFEILSANPDEMGNEAFLDYLANKPDPLADYMIEMLRDTCGTETYKTILRNDMAYYSATRNSAATRLIVNELADTSYSSLDSVRYWLNEKNNLGNEFTEVDSYLHENNTSSASGVLSSISNSLELGDWSQDELSYFTTYKNLLISLADSGNTIFEIDSIQKLTIDSIACSSEYIAGAQARGLLRFVFHEDSVLVPFIDTSSFKSSPVVFGNKQSNRENKMFKVIPVPASDWLSFEYIMPAGCSEGNIKIIDWTGKQIKSFQVNQKRGVKNIGLEEFPSGSYFCIFIANGNIIGKQKIVIVK